jgi:hypothetical protein
LNDLICTSSKSGASERFLIFPKLTLVDSFVEDILLKTGFFNCSYDKTSIYKKIFLEKIYPFFVLAEL